jgi:hypothetical protein
VIPHSFQQGLFVSIVIDDLGCLTPSSAVVVELL